MVECSVPGCENVRRKRSWCSKHYGRWLRHGSLERWPNGKPPGCVNLKGYQLLYRPESLAANARGYALEHRHVMTEHLERALLGDEQVHHVNGDKLDNRLANLELWSSSHPAGQRVEDKVAWCKMLLARYEPTALAQCDIVGI